MTKPIACFLFIITKNLGAGNWIKMNKNPAELNNTKCIVERIVKYVCNRREFLFTLSYILCT